MIVNEIVTQHHTGTLWMDLGRFGWFHVLVTTYVLAGKFTSTTQASTREPCSKATKAFSLRVPLSQPVVNEDCCKITPHPPRQGSVLFHCIPVSG